ncbi:TRAP transporter small permease [Pseudalkalibacillus decolorationis]|uniref:TRAP transporter small permease n=1 Tax=Pseudalkalibacillus decolorationis TaxID=163879 RepID=UPI0021472F9E|nr:TRAP transporter small permease [Pseudalkalibacillus decolorationis]
MQTLKKLLDRTVEFFTCTLLVVMVLGAIWQVFSRYVLNSPSTFTSEFLRYALIWVSMLGGAYAFGKKKHLAIVFIKRKFSGKMRLAVNVFIELLLITFATVVMIYGGLAAVKLALGEISPTLGIPVGYVYLAVPLSGIFIIGYSVIELAHLLMHKSEGERKEVKTVV